jgi:hypothetical protein
MCIDVHGAFHWALQKVDGAGDHPSEMRQRGLGGLMPEVSLEERS